MPISKYFKATALVLGVSCATLVGLKGCAVVYHPDPKKGDNQAIPGGPYSFVLVGENNQQIARHVTGESSCPKITIDGREFQMTERGENNSPTEFEQVIVCEYLLGSAPKKVSIDGVDLAVLPAEVNRIAIIGDTGCRMKISTFQNCNNVKGGGEPWPFEKLANQLVTENADVVLHMGDFHYRETPCPLLNLGCKGPWGFNWASWQADYFEPAKGLLNKVPWVLTRGNHEDCNRAYKGWFYFLDPYPLADDIWQSCQDYTPTYKVEFNDLTVLQMDSATMPNPFADTVNPKTQKIYTELFNEVNELSEGASQSWLFTHRPLWAVSSYFDWNAFKKDLSVTDKTMQAAIASSKLGEFAPSVNLILSGHIHNFEALSFNVDRPALMVVGDSGTRLSPIISVEQESKLQELLKQIQVNREDFFVDGRFAYVIMERLENRQWLVKFTGIDGITHKTFRLEGRKLVPQD